MTARDTTRDLDAVFYNPRGAPLTVKTYVNGEFTGEARSSDAFIELSFEGLGFKAGMSEIAFAFDGDISDASLMRFDFR
jgi:hypothetical protein